MVEFKKIKTNVVPFSVRGMEGVTWLELNNAAQFYYKHELDRLRAEVCQSPKRSIQEIFETALDRDTIGKGEMNA